MIGLTAVAGGCGDDPLGPLPEMVDDVAGDVREAGESGKRLIENPERVRRAADDAREGWKHGPPRIGK